ncbi:phospholipid/glycerol acyltransferase [Thiobacillus denitrificans ATCC 25259]|uniref:Phospholipid/glycerol acyltransferase n=1 Tax=Thiobacillus denitrificans (strain ATCC 25259 / T1) TaxID=292415 RepID=Q3SGF2_THIDA|nr:lysophospholipid acyltransferase family protein [Thiobacillus denitrificans]AAZ98298.1 phospholipid/glycerol acyltransferase [Thiobacillus denitrificans ATCC 25259]
MSLVRSLVFAVLQTALTILFSLVALLSFPFSAHARYRLITGYNHTVIWLARWVLGIRYVVEGREHLPAEPAVILAKHQSAWETVAFLFLFPPVSPVIKQELLKVPFFGWAFRMLSPIAIDRAAGREALKQIVRQGKDKLAQGFWVLVFPEGTRVAPGEKGRYGIGGAWLAAESGAPVVPVAHNAGEVWPKNAFVKHPGTITVRIGPAIDSREKSAAELTRAVEAWIEAEMGRLPPAAARQ